MKLNYKILLTLAVLNLSLIASAIPAKPGLRTFIQPDGTTLTIKKIGDENSHFVLTEDNKLLIADTDGAYKYAYVDSNNRVRSTGVTAVNSANRPKAHAAFLTDFDDVDFESIDLQRRARGTANRAAKIKGVGTLDGNFPTVGNIRGLILLVQYSDVQFETVYETSAKQYFNDLINKRGFSDFNGTGCATEYFEDMSFNQFKPQFDVVGPITLPNPMAYYGANDEYGNDVHPELMVVDACKLIDSQVNFADYDNDNDGYCDNVYVIYAGYGENASGTTDSVWPHSWEISAAQTEEFKLDGVVINHYACSSEMLDSATKTPDGIGTFVHEFSHVMGLPDLYDTSYTYTYYTPGKYSVMDSGSYNNNSRTPAGYTVYERNAMGWIDIEELNSPKMVELGNIAETNQGYVIRTQKENEFFLLENRQQTGWDTYLPHHGMLIWHIDYSQYSWNRGTVNNNKDHMRVTIVKASNISNGVNTSILKGWPWPGSRKRTEFTSTTTPALQDWNGNAIDVPITNIQEIDGVISFEVMGGMAAGVKEVSGADASFAVSTADREVVVATDAAVVEVYNAMGQLVASERVSDGMATLTVPASGLYIVRANAHTAKVVLK